MSSDAVTITLPGPPVTFLGALRFEHPSRASRIIRALNTTRAKRAAIDTEGTIAEVLSRVSCLDVISKRGAGRRSLLTLRNFAFAHGVPLKCGCGESGSSFGLFTSCKVWDKIAATETGSGAEERGPALQWAHASAPSRARPIALLDKEALELRADAQSERDDGRTIEALRFEGEAMEMEAAAAVLRGGGRG